jgi:beta-glucanase (GH16 family)
MSRNVSLLNNEPFSDAFHTFAVDKEEGVIRWALDGGEYSEMTPSDITMHNWSFDEDFHFTLNVAVGGDWYVIPTAKACKQAFLSS